MVVRRNWLSCCVERNRSNLGRNTTCGDQRTSSMITHKGYVIGVGWLLTVQPDFVLNDTWNAISPGHNHQCYRIKPHEQLVSVSLTHYCASTPDLSTSWSRTTLQGAQGPGRSHLETSFPLRCFQRLSLPHIATRRCHWRDNRYTRGVSTPVLSY